MLNLYDLIDLRQALKGAFTSGGGFSSEFTAAQQKSGLSFAGYIVLRNSAQVPDHSISMVSEVLGTTVAAATGAIDRMDVAVPGSLGLVERYRHYDDRRKIYVRPTALGDAVIVRVHRDAENLAVARCAKA